jgi:hypothetical protein
VVIYNPGWQPYCDHGHWVYTDCGWYWFSDYSWGWAPFHYGRWFQHSRWGWCWTPDTVWGPSWVTWRYSNDYCGWAPLPPRAVYREGVGFFYNGLAVSVGFDFGLSWNCFAFVPIGHFCDPHPRRYCVAPAQITQVYNHTTVINNFNGHGRNLANRGIDPEHITAVTHTPIRPVAIRDTTAPSGHGPRADQLSRDGSTLIVGRPGSMNNPAPGGNRNNRPPQSGSPAQNRSPQPNNNRSASQTRQGGQPQEHNEISVPAQRPSSSANYNSSPKPYYDSRTISPRGREHVIPMRGQPHLLPTRVNPAHPKPATIAHQPPRPSSARNTTNRHHRRPRHQDRRDKIRTKTVPATTPTTVPAMVRVAVRGIDWPLVLLVKRRGVQVAPGVFAFATPPPLAKSARGHHAAAI